MAIPLIGAVTARLGGSTLGRLLMRGTSEAFGMHYVGGKSMGFLGLKDPALKTMGGFRKVGTLGLRSLGVAGTAFSIYQGYQEEGLYGAAKGAAGSIAVGAAWHAAAGLIGNPATWGIAAAAGMGYGYYQFGEAAQSHRRRVRGVEMGGGMQDVIGGGAALTERARAIQALSNTHINARMALGNEAVLTHSSYR